MKPTCQDFVFARDGGMGRSPTEEAIIDYIDRSEEVAPPSPAVEREIVVGSTWANCDGGHVIVTGIDDYGVRYSWVSDGERGERTPRLFRERWSHVSDPQPASPDARRKDLCTCGHRREGHVIDGYCLACPNCAGFTDVNAPDPTDPGVIRAAEGVVLEPGEYEVVEIAARDEDPGLTVGQRFALKYRLEPLTRVGESIWGTRHTLLTAVRRVQEQAPQAAFSRDDTIAADCGAFIPAPQAEAATGERADHCPSCYSGNRQRAEGCSDSFHRTARPEVAPATPRSEPAADSPELAQAKQWRKAELNAHPMHGETDPRSVTERLDSASKLAVIQKLIEALRQRDTALSRITRLEASLETARFELSNGIEVMNARQEHDRARIAELVAVNDRLDEELQQGDDAIEAAGGNRERGIAAFIATRSVAPVAPQTADLLLIKQTILATSSADAFAAFERVLAALSDTDPPTESPEPAPGVEAPEVKS